MRQWVGRLAIIIAMAIDATTGGSTDVSSQGMEVWEQPRVAALPNFFTNHAHDISEYRSALVVVLHHNKAAGTSTKAFMQQVAHDNNRKRGG